VITDNRLKYLLIVFAIMVSTSAFAGESEPSSVWARAQDSLLQTWDSDSYELYIPIHTWHNRHYYSSEKIDSYNEQPWGLGVGKYRIDKDGDWHALYIMAFQDSHNDIEPAAGYAFQNIWGAANHVRLGLGYTVGMTIRQDTDYLPTPVIAPLMSVAYQKIALDSTYIIGGDGYGNILFTWLRWKLD
jgi:lipid IVA palmitoyltransferase